MFCFWLPSALSISRCYIFHVKMLGIIQNGLQSCNLVSSNSRLFFFLMIMLLFTWNTCLNRTYVRLPCLHNGLTTGCKTKLSNTLLSTTVKLEWQVQLTQLDETFPLSCLSWQSDFHFRPSPRKDLHILFIYINSNYLEHNQSHNGGGARGEQLPERRKVPAIS